MFSNVFTLRTVFCNRVTLSTDNSTFHSVKKFIFYQTQWMQYITNTSNTVHLDTKEKNNNKNCSVYLNTPDIDLKLTDGNFLKSLSQNKHLSYSYLTNNGVANKLATLIKDDLLKNMSYVVELNPGFGLLTKELLQAGVPFIHLYESNDVFREYLNNLSTTFPNQLSLNIFKPCYMQKLLSYITLHNDNENENESLCKKQKKKWEEESCMQIIGATTTTNFIRHLIISVVFQRDIMLYGRPIFYLTISKPTYMRLIQPARSRSVYILFNMLFNFHVFGTLDSKAFIPHDKSKNRSRKPLMNNNCFFLIKVEPKPDLFTLFKSQKNLIYFWHFVRHHFYKPREKVIPALEKIIPGCGVKLIAQNYNIFTEFGDLTPTQALNLFCELQSWPEFEQSTFVLSAKYIGNLYDSFLEE